MDGSAETYERWKAWFNVHDRVMLKAWRQVMTTGAWPEWFQRRMAEDEIVLPEAWTQITQGMLAEAWVDHVIGKK
jgi:hypothetical protein